MAKRSFFERLTGATNVEGAEFEHDMDIHQPHQTHFQDDEYQEPVMNDYQDEEYEAAQTQEEDLEGELAVDVYDLGNLVVIKAMTAGVRKEELEIHITRDQVAIRGSRYDADAPNENQFLHQELYWGAFSRVVNLPSEVEIDQAKAEEAHGVLTITLPKSDTNRMAQLRVK